MVDDALTGLTIKELLNFTFVIPHIQMFYWIGRRGRDRMVVGFITTLQH
jgi:hypothetical protein